ncbi:MAG: alpha/beta hydrolase-fold protein, partial [Bacteroidota bacterium]
MTPSRFRTTELSDPRFEAPNRRTLTVHSTNLRGRGDICLYVPEAPGENLPLVILLHGVYGSAWVWNLKGGASATTHRLIETEETPPVVVAMPSDGLWEDGSGYLPHHARDFEAWIVEDVIAAVRENIVGVGEASPVFIAGLSMGGYGALRLGAKYPEVFAGFSGHSSITKLDDFADFVAYDLPGTGPARQPDPFGRKRWYRKQQSPQNHP